MEIFIQTFLSNSNNKKILSVFFFNKMEQNGTKWNNVGKFFVIFLMDKTIYYIYDDICRHLFLPWSSKKTDLCKLCIFAK